MTTFIDKILSKPPKSRAAMIKYLAGHFRYDTMGSWNQATSYANCIKVRHLNLTPAQAEACYAMLDVEMAHDLSGFNGALREFDDEHKDVWQIGSNGRSGGYLVLYQGGQKHSGHYSHCTNCGQRNFEQVPPENPTPEQYIRMLVHRHPWPADVIFKHFAELADPVIAFFKSPQTVLEILRNEQIRLRDKTTPRISDSNICGKCGQPTRVNYPLDRLPVQIFTCPGKGLDMDEFGSNEPFANWDIDQLRDRTQLIWDFDMACENACQRFLDFAMNNTAEEQEIMVPRKVIVAVPIGA